MDVLPFRALRLADALPSRQSLLLPGLEPLSRFCAKAGSERFVLPGTIGGSALSRGAQAGTGSIVGDERAGLFAYRQDFRSETGIEKSRLGIVGLLDPDGDSESRTYLVQETEPFGVDYHGMDFARTERQESLVVVGIEDSKFRLEALVERAMALREVPDLDFDFTGGDRHRFWKIDSKTLIEEVRAFFRGQDGFVFDGLHVYRALRRLQRGGHGKDEAAPAVCPLTVFFNFLDLGIGLGAASILLGDLGNFQINETMLRLDAYFDVKAYPFGGADSLPKVLATFREDLRIRGFTDCVVGALFGGVDQFFLCALREGVDLAKLYLPDVKAPLREFDSVMLREVILPRCVGLGAVPPGSPSQPVAPEYSWSVEESIAAVQSGRFRAAFFLNPPNKRKLMALARAELRLPPGALRLEPSLRSRMLMRAVH